MKTVSNTAAYRSAMYGLLAYGKLSPWTFRTEVRMVLGVQPVPQAASPRDMTETGYVGQFLQWGSTDVARFRYTLTRLFGSALPKADQHDQDTMVQHNCRKRIDITQRATEATANKKRLTDRFAQYFTFPPTMMRPTFSVFDMEVPTYDVADLPGAASLPITRQLAINRGFERTERLASAHLYIAGLSEVLRAAKLILADTMSPEKRALLLQNHPQFSRNFILAYLLEGSV